MRPSRDGKSFVYRLDYVDTDGKRRRVSLGRADKRKAEKERAKQEKLLRMGAVSPGSMRLRDFVADGLRRTGDQICESTRQEYDSAMKDFISVIGNKDYQQVTIRDAERYRQECLDRGNKPATVAKKLREIKCVFELAVKRRHLDENPLAHIKMPKASQNEIHTYSDRECERIIKAAREFVAEQTEEHCPRWDLLVLVALCTGLRRGELLNCTWSDVDFEEQTITVAPKDDTAETWLWLIKDTDRRTLPLTDELTQLLADHQSQQPEGYPYVFVPPARYDFIQNELRRQGLWSYSDSRLKVINNFGRDFGKILLRAGVKEGEFHDLRRTAICNWFEEGMSELEVMRLAGHADFKTTHKYYLTARDDVVHRARNASARALRRSGTLWHAPLFAPKKRNRLPSVNA
jgi:integrase